MRKLILTIAVALSGLTLVAQTNNSNEPTVEFDVHRNLYLVYTDANNFHHVTEDGVLHGKFKFSTNNVIVEGTMYNGRRHGTMITTIDGKETSSVEFMYGKPIAVTRRLD